MNPLDASLLQGWAPWTVLAVGAVALVSLLLGPRLPGSRRWWTRVLPLTLLAGAAVFGVLLFVVEVLWRPFPDGIPGTVRVWIAVAVGGLALAVVVLVRGGWRRRAGALIAMVLVCAAAAQGVNLHYRAYPTARVALGLPYAEQVELADVAGPVANPVSSDPLEGTWTAPADLPDGGALARVDIPGTVSGFAARPGWVYLPPAYLTANRPLLPVLVLLAGQPGSPKDWLDGGMLADRMDAYAAAHHGLAPVVVIPDDLGSTLANPLCLDSNLGNVQTYLDTDVPNWVTSTLQVDPDRAHWAIGGLSHGGTCALQLAVNAPSVYPTFVDLSGQDEPSLGDRTRTVAAAFGGDEARFAAVNPLDVLAAGRVPRTTAGFLVAGADDAQFLPQARRVHQALLDAGIDVQYRELPGSHSWQVWGPGFAAALPWLGTRMGITR